MDAHRRYKGTVLRWCKRRGWGYVQADEFPGDVLAHHSTIQMTWPRNLEAGERVDMLLQRSEKGIRATKVWLLDRDGGADEVEAGSELAQERFRYAFELICKALSFAGEHKLDATNMCRYTAMQFDEYAALLEAEQGSEEFDGGEGAAA